jgi:hypothetical protein
MTTQRRMTALLPLHGGGPPSARGRWLKVIGPGSGPDRPRSGLGLFLFLEINFSYRLITSDTKNGLFLYRTIGIGWTS